MAKCSSGKCSINCSGGCGCISISDRPAECRCLCFGAGASATKLRHLAAVLGAAKAAKKAVNVCFRGVPATQVAQIFEAVFPGRVSLPASLITRKVSVTLKGVSAASVPAKLGLRLSARG